jgi:hypothetical protein
MNPPVSDKVRYSLIDEGMVRVNGMKTSGESTTINHGENQPIGGEGFTRRP